MNDMTHPRAKFRAMTEGTQEDWDIIAAEQKAFAPDNGARILDHLKLLAGAYGGFPVDRLTHCLQTATTAHRYGRHEEYVVMALPHDIEIGRASCRDRACKCVENSGGRGTIHK